MPHAAPHEGIHPTNKPGSPVRSPVMITSWRSSACRFGGDPADHPNGGLDRRSRSGYEKDTPESSRHVKVLGTVLSHVVAATIEYTLTRRNAINAGRVTHGNA